MKEEELSKLREEMKSQDNAATENPLFVVFDWEKVPTEEGYSDEYEYIDMEEGVTVAKTKEELIEHAKDDEDYKASPTANLDAMMEWELLEWLTKRNNGIPLRKVFYLKRECFVTAFFTRKAAQAFIDANHYHYKEPHIYVATLWRNYEMSGIQDTIIDGEFEIVGGKKDALEKALQIAAKERYQIFRKEWPFSTKSEDTWVKSKIDEWMAGANR